MFDLEVFRTSISNEDVERVYRNIQYFVDNKVENAYEVMANGMAKTSNPLIRNALALALADVKYEDTVEIIIQLLKSEKTEGHRGTLLWALQSFDYMTHIEFLYQLVKSSNMELCSNTFTLLEKVSNELPLKIREKIIEDAEETIEVLYDVIDLLRKDNE